MLASESGVTAQPPGWSHAVGFNFHFHNWQEYAEMCEDVVALHEKALAEKNLRCATPDMSTEKNWIRVWVIVKNAYNITPIEISQNNRCLPILGMGLSNLEKVT